MTSTATAAGELLSLDEISERLEMALKSSPADETELVWIESGETRVTNRGQPAIGRLHRHRVVMVRVLDRGRVGSYRCGDSESNHLSDAIRQAVAQSRTREPLRGLPHLPSDASHLPRLKGLYDEAVAALQPGAGHGMLSELARRREMAKLRWGEARVAVFNSHGLRRRIEITGADLWVRCSRKPGGGRAAGSARCLEDLQSRAIFERARRRHGSGGMAEPLESAVLCLAPEAVIELCNLLNHVALSASSYAEGHSFLREHLNVQVFDRAIHLSDDGTAPGLPFPFDLEGTVKRPVDLIAAGTPKAPALDQRQAAVLGLPPTAHAIGGNDARAQHLFLRPGEADDVALLGAADATGNGLFVNAIEQLECFDPRRVMFRALLTGVRRIDSQRLGQPVPDLVWEDSLLRVLSNVPALGRFVVHRLEEPSILGATSAPGLVTAEVSGLRPADQPHG